MSNMLVLFDFELDDECYKVRLALSLMGIGFTRRKVDVLPGREPEGPALRLLNPLGRIPILQDGSTTLHDPQAIIAYAAYAHAADPAWLPREPAAFGAVMMWLGYAGHELATVRTARAQAMHNITRPDPHLVAQARNALLPVEDHLTRRRFTGQDWLVSDHPTIAEPTIFSAFMLSRDFGLEHDEFPALRRWARRVRDLPGFTAMPGIPAFG